MSDVSDTNLAPDLRAAAEDLWRYLAVNQPPEPADVIFVFGGNDLLVPRQAAALFRAGLAPLVLVTGVETASRNLKLRYLRVR
jgi:hypothetical protein